MPPPLPAPSAAKSTPSAARRRHLLLVPLLTAVSAGLLVARLVWDADTFQDCRYLGPSTRMYVTSWTGLACSLGSVLVHVARSRATPRRGMPTWTTWQQRLTTVSAVLGLLPASALLATVYWLYSADPSGGSGCSGLAHLVAP
ncbi:hypothetical protein ABZ471_48025 [Streptomyces sp. NPDC005728]|uniref:hypothetical protein n=1 Tax=Streptomyces sp. NPDC005728 TaxID=3157054 RepID=UPI0033F12550